MPRFISSGSDSGGSDSVFYPISQVRTLANKVAQQTIITELNSPGV